MIDSAEPRSGPGEPPSSPKTDRLIERLTADLEPVRPLPRLRSAFAVVLAIWAAFLSLGLLGSGAGFGGMTLLGDWIYGVCFAGLLAAALGGTLSALAAGIPGRERIENTGLVLACVGLLLAAAACLVGIGGAASTASPAGLDGMCFRHAAWSSLLPAGVILTFLTRGWATRPILAASAALLASGALGALLVHLSCGFISPRHLLMGHLSVPVVLVLLGLYPLSILIQRLRS
jgi:hypothetical protein